MMQKKTIHAKIDLKFMLKAQAGINCREEDPIAQLHVDIPNLLLLKRK